ncbi:hypothetical protein SISSUDRAFT_769199 [Sistotremastrum suecicum HHB10207 ss-3]|uniref:Uncharacterized protein n=1 Tax=Sistotremastrum suecicum HHB10207 ss-3 TaxID=1314776 RepID=A0A166D9H4_9AGAM|nr:hypothetical protein SISSUDRAFT_769199 [Sistotremastrum suecicum HHB10207 ss-3]
MRKGSPTSRHCLAKGVEANLDHQRCLTPSASGLIFRKATNVEGHKAHKVRGSLWIIIEPPHSGRIVDFILIPSLLLELKQLYCISSIIQLELCLFRIAPGLGSHLHHFRHNHVLAKHGCAAFSLNWSLSFANTIHHRVAVRRPEATPNTSIPCGSQGRVTLISRATHSTMASQYILRHIQHYSSTWILRTRTH